MRRSLLLLFAGAPLAYAPAALQGKELYEALYATGWGKDTRVSQGAKLLHTIRNMRRQGAAIDSVLDVGCSHGNVVAELWQSGIVASGVDIARGAADLATSLHKPPHGRASCNGEGRPCFQAASATSLPFRDGAFDAIASSDVLEHVDPSDVRAATAEFARVARNFLVLKIANRPEGSTLSGSRAGVGKFQGRTFKDALHQQGYADRLPTQLHTTVKGNEFWHEEFRRVGFALNRTIPDASWACCAYVLHRIEPYRPSKE
ncbi:hypothetical protein EMIHUDRAFT_226321 [Emiliania huxleyi CCMP1516]|uniref:Methyltransferase type 11 domain-containing protein n=2 Tax=Emiliania huxleyi TaxID=2903 RepID=A0A0D3KLA7_EMIH1|nr:hypothetical protein EMIHUDRAFT_245480 [Emiliania huxleyi CCMP1516]XP_005788971.1 hypothetical protein EMIHUDRAFT_226321 [Emiliania huxleyi CCMP1516]EOD15876.1 hypothetical protein EMIHUDRAFT_245480 [Emiliania huxleyi CCMP1516]EOD36542.1 hypothetical protein EMIHUDRAFT_226321 [Emiliania huxleyi CCMP1516]|eukprot:XP_005768305.1 hypothetical protein EMIHUDRAFT_245480 [Emiliania huxleyi CCMP1516]